ncbi:FLYWCH-type zinc finger-containing protein 1 [Phymastichus coffea]|uniref:FLYWCH-type zinc finger-containing protein 1 n=1 Tax=Phymastichus coffea TaxID=108790 RepID=UPI00273B0B61|nr:FLYWCH-type zinc finger-containing protein 1 [Phymastichus coffea]
MGTEVTDNMIVSVKEERIEESEVPELVISNKGGPKLIYQGFMYTLHKKSSQSIRWRCVLRTHQCRGSLITNLECRIPYVRMSHDHPTDYAAVEIARQRYRTFGEPLHHWLHNSDGASAVTAKRRSANNAPPRRGVKTSANGESFITK